MAEPAAPPSGAVATAGRQAQHLHLLQAIALAFILIKLIYILKAGPIADEAYYRPVVAKESAQLFADAGGATAACGAKDLVRVGTPVNVLQKSGTMSQVVLLDIMWRWGQADPCPAILRGPVWIASEAISADYPSR